MSGLLVDVSLQVNSLIILLASFLLVGMALFISLFQLQDQTSRHLLALLLLNCLLSWVFVAMRESWISSEEMVVWVSLQMLQGPLLYGYVRSQVLPYVMHTKKSPKVLLHVLPALIMAGVWLWQLSDANLFRVACPIESQCSAQYEMRFVHRLAAWVSVFIYGYYALRLLPQYMTRIKNHYSALQGLKLTWLTYLIWCFILLTALAVMLDVLRYGGMVLWLYGGFIQAWGPIILMVFVAGFSMRQRKINQQMGSSGLSMFDQPADAERTHLDDASDIAEVTTPADASSETAIKYQTSGLDDALAQQLWGRLTHLMEEEALYLKHGLKIGDVAAELSVSVNYVSQAINSQGKQSFYDWVNQYRLDHALELLADETLTVTDIAEASGFASQSSFYGNFKSRYQMTPRQYRQKP